MTTARPSVRVFAPGSVGNVGPGLDIMGMAVAGAGDIVEAAAAARPGVVVHDAGHPDLPREAGANTAALAAIVCDRAPRGPKFLRDVRRACAVQPAEAAAAGVSVAPAPDLMRMP